MVLKVEVSGIKNRRHIAYSYHLLDFYDEKKKTTAMARTTAYTASIVAHLILKKTLKDKGLVPVEKIGADPELFKMIIGELQKHHVNVAEEVTGG